MVFRVLQLPLKQKIFLKTGLFTINILLSRRVKNLITYKNKRIFKIETIFENKWVTKLIHKLMKSGKKAVMEKIIYSVFSSFKTQTSFFDISHFLIHNLELIKPIMELRVRRRGRQFIFVPFPLIYRRQFIKSLSNIVYHIRDKQRLKKSLKFRVLTEFCNLNNEKEIKLLCSRNKLYNKITKNRTFIRFRWV